MLPVAFFVASAVFFLLDAFRVKSPYSLSSIGFACLALGFAASLPAFPFKM